MRTNVNHRWEQSTLVGAVLRWLRPPKKKRTMKDQTRRRSSSANIIIPDAHDPFMLLAKDDPMSDLLAENYRLRSLINDLLREERRSNSPY